MDMERCVSCYRQWIVGQEADLAELEAASANAAAGRATDAELRAVVERCMRGYQDYLAGRRALSPDDGTAFLAPPWCTAFEKSVLWLGGCRPTLTIRLLYNLSGEGLEEQFEAFMTGCRSPVPSGSMGITAAQLALINSLHGRTVHQEDALSERQATLQEDIADRPLLPVVRRRAAEAAQLRAAAGCDGEVGVAAGTGGADAEVEAALSRYKAGLAQLVAEADELRMATARALATEILTPRQAVEMLAAGKQLHLSLRECSRRAEGAGAGARQQLNGHGPRPVTTDNTSAASRRRNP